MSLSMDFKQVYKDYSIEKETRIEIVFLLTNYLKLVT